MTTVTIRGFRPSDVEAVVGLINACNAADDWSFRESVPSFQLGDCDPCIHLDRHSLVADADGRAVGYARMFRERGTRLFVIMWLEPAWRGQGLEKQLIERLWGEASAFAEPAFDVGARCSQPTYASTLRELGFYPVRSWWSMRIDLRGELPPPTFPPGIELRPFVVGQDETMLTELINDVFAEHWGEGQHTLDGIRAEVAMPDFHSDLLLFAEKEGQVVGYVWSWADRKIAAAGDARAYIGDLGVRKAYRDQGLGRALLLRALHDVKRRGAVAAELDVDGPNASAKRLYESVGFREQQELRWFRKELHTPHQDTRAPE
jgi:mycothiol synthase